MKSITLNLNRPGVFIRLFFVILLIQRQIVGQKMSEEIVRKILMVICVNANL